MLIKSYYPNTMRWKMIDNVESIDFDHAQAEVPEKTTPQIFYKKRNDDTIYALILESTTYVLNDEGKTIERIN